MDGSRRLPDVAEEKKLSRRSIEDDDALNDEGPGLPPADNITRVKFEIFGEEMIEKRVKASGNSGRVYLPPDWVGHKVKIIRID
jgi:putative transposon-encoded protein